MFYDVNGNEMSAGYSVSGTMLTRGYDVNGNPIDAVVEPYTIDNVVSYYQQSTLDMVDEINDLSDDILPFVIITDSHGTNNAQNSQAIGAYIVRNSRANRLFHLGDVAYNLWSEEEYRTWFTPLLNACQSQLYFACGNHEFFSGSYTKLECVYNDVLANKSYLSGNPEHFYYYFDDPSYKVRFIVINTSDGQASAFSSAQNSWLSSTLSSTPSNYKVVIFGHFDIMPNDPITDQWNSGQASTITATIKTCPVPIVGYFCGHEHLDRVVKVDDSFWMITCLNDSCAKDSSTSIVNPTRTRGTVSEQAVSIVCANIKTGDVEIKRIGAKNPDIDLSYNFND